jgi:hypothetical protein
LKDFVVPLYYFFNRKKRSAVVSTPRGTTWNLVRGGTRTYNLGAQFAGRTGWAMAVGTPTEFTISAAGVITAVLPHLYTTPRNLTVITDQGNLRIPTTSRDWFPNETDGHIPSAHFSVARSYSPEAREMFTLQIRDPSNWSGDPLVDDIVISSGADGYADITPLNAARVGITEGLVVIKSLRDQINETDMPRMEDDLGNSALFGYILNGVLTTYTSPGGHFYCVGAWNASDLNSGWSTPSILSAKYRQDQTHGLSVPRVTLLSIVQDRTPDSTTHRELDIGDFNSWPGLRSTGTTGNYQFSTNTFPNPSVTVPAANRDEWLLIHSGYVRNPAGGALMNHKQIDIFSLINNFHDDDSHTSNIDIHAGAGFRIVMGNYNFTEVQFHVTADTAADGDNWIDNIVPRFAENAAAVFGNTNQNY